MKTREEIINACEKAREVTDSPLFVKCLVKWSEHPENEPEPAIVCINWDHDSFVDAILSYTDSPEEVCELLEPDNGEDFWITDVKEITDKFPW